MMPDQGVCFGEAHELNKESLGSDVGWAPKVARGGVFTRGCSTNPRPTFSRERRHLFSARCGQESQNSELIMRFE